MLSIRPALCLLAIVLASPVLAQKPGGAPASPPPAVEPELPASDLLLRYEGPTLSFRWSLAPEAALEPALVRELRSSAIADRAKAQREAEEGARAAGDAGRRMQYEWIERWQPDAETDVLLALSARQYSFTGGAHGNLAPKAVIWDRALGHRLAFGQLFADPQAMKAALKPAFCKALDEERKARRGGVANAMFNDCPDPFAYPIVPVGDGKIAEIRVLVPPYEAGPWAEGSYDITLPASVVRAFLLPRFASVFTGD